MRCGSSPSGSAPTGLGTDVCAISAPTAMQIETRAPMSVIATRSKTSAMSKGSERQDSAHASVFSGTSMVRFFLGESGKVAIK